MNNKNEIEKNSTDMSKKQYNNTNKAKIWNEEIKKLVSSIKPTMKNYHFIGENKPTLLNANEHIVQEC